MKKNIFILCLTFLTGINISYAADSVQSSVIHARIENCGKRILYSNRLYEPVTFIYDERGKNSKVTSTKALFSRKVIIYPDTYNKIGNNDELAAYLARDIALVIRTYDGVFGGKLRTLQIKAAPKKYEIVSDKVAVDYMVKAGYNPIALITLIKKTAPDKKYSAVATKNNPSKRLAIIYEYIYTKYPYFLANNAYFENPYYQKFLEDSVNNRKLLEQKIKANSKEELEYE